MKLSSRPISGFFLGALAYAALATFSGYDNVTEHRTINGAIVDQFLAQTKAAPFAGLEHYDFDFTSLLSGTAIITADARERIEGVQRQSVREWVVHGGYSADEPEGFQALRHFYDPTQADGSRHLTDITNLQALAAWSGSATTGEANPQLDAVTWALEDTGQITQGLNQVEQRYSWSDGKRAFREALETTDLTSRATQMALAWRSLGETLHLLADLGCPPHVRNDGHPPYLTRLESVVNFWGDPDPYEQAATSETLVSGGHPDLALISRLAAAPTVRDLLHGMAAYTNAEFFTEQTISGNAGGQTIRPFLRPDAPYPLPALAESGGGWAYDPSTFSFTKEIAGTPVKMCHDKWYFGLRSSRPRVDLESALSQASVLVPTIVGAGSHVLERFIPRLKIEVTSATGGVVKGHVVHTTNAEYPVAIQYAGPIEVKNSVSGQLVHGAAMGGQFEVSAVDTSVPRNLVVSLPLPGMTISASAEVAVAHWLETFDQTIDTPYRQYACGGFYDLSNPAVVMRTRLSGSIEGIPNEDGGFDYGISYGSLNIAIKEDKPLHVKVRAWATMVPSSWQWKSPTPPGADTETFTPLPFEVKPTCSSVPVSTVAREADGSWSMDVTLSQLDITEWSDGCSQDPSAFIASPHRDDYSCTSSSGTTSGSKQLEVGSFGVHFYTSVN